jgi:hypothetical protein
MRAMLLRLRGSRKASRGFDLLLMQGMFSLCSTIMLIAAFNCRSHLGCGLR